jgi:hypothetical protein
MEVIRKGYGSGLRNERLKKSIGKDILMGVMREVKKREHQKIEV